MYSQSQLGSCQSGGPTVIALQATARDQRVAPVVYGVGGDELQLAYLIAAQGTAGQVVALDPQAMPATPLLRGACEVLQGSWRVGQVYLAGVDQRHPQPMDFNVPLGRIACR